MDILAKTSDWEGLCGMWGNTGAGSRPEALVEERMVEVAIMIHPSNK